MSYMADGVMCLSESVAGYLGGSCLQVRFADLMSGESQDERTGDEIALDIIERAGLKVNGT